MIRKFLPGQHVIFISQVKARTIPSLGGSYVIVNQGAIGEVKGFNNKGTYEEEDDDFYQVEIESGDEASGKKVWISNSELHKIKLHN